MSTIIETKRLLLREIEASDIEYLATLLGDATVMRFWPAPFTRAQAAEWIDRRRAGYARHGYDYWLAIERASGKPIGQAGLLQVELDGVGEPSLGYIFQQSAWGFGFAQEAAGATLHWALAKRGVQRVTCLVQPRNVPSLRVAARLGLMPERHVEYKGHPHIVFATTRETWSVSEHQTR